MAHIRKLASCLRVENLAVWSKHGQCGHALVDRDAVLRGDVYVGIHVADPYVDEDEIFIEQFRVGGLVKVDVENLAIAAPVAAKVQDHAFVLTLCLGQPGCDIGGGISGLGVEMLRRGRGNRLRRSWLDQSWSVLPRNQEHQRAGDKKNGE